MVVRWLSTLGLIASAGMVQGEVPKPPATLLPPAAMATQTPAPTNCEPPVLLQVPEARPAPRKPCKSCSTDYNPNHVYLPEQNPDCTQGGCDGDCHSCRKGWFDAEFFVGASENLPNVNRKFLYGAFATAGYWFDEDRSMGIDLSFLTAYGTYQHSAAPVFLDSPFSVSTADASFRGELISQDKFRIDGLIGYRYLQFNEDYQLATPAFIADLSVRNEIHAAQVGFVANVHYGPYLAELVGKVALGENTITSERNGLRTTDTELTVLSTVGARLGYQLGESLWGTLGYQMLNLSNIDRPTMHGTDYFLHGFTIGLLKRF